MSSTLILYLISYLLLESCFHASAAFFHSFILFHMFLFGYFSVLLYFVLHIKRIKKKIFEKSEKYKNSVYFVNIGTCVPWMAIETKFSKLCISCRLDKHLYAQLIKWALWLLFVMSKIKLSLILNTRITLFDGKD